MRGKSTDSLITAKRTVKNLVSKELKRKGITFLYHTTFSSYRKSIKEKGLQQGFHKNWHEDFQAGVYLWANDELAEEYSHTLGEPGQEMDIWEVNVEGLVLYEDDESEEDSPSYFTKEVPANKLNLAFSCLAEDWEDRFG